MIRRLAGVSAVRRLSGAVGWLLDSLTRYVPDCAPIKFDTCTRCGVSSHDGLCPSLTLDDDRLAELNAQADAASVEYGAGHPLGRASGADGPQYSKAA